MNFYPFIALTSAIVSIWCANLVYSEDQKSHVHRTFALMCAVQAYISFASFMMHQATEPHIALFWMRMNDLWSLDLALLLHFVLLITRAPLARSKPVIAGIYGIALIVVAISYWHDFTSPEVVLEYWGWARVLNVKSAAGMANMLWPTLSGILGLAWVIKCFLTEKNKRRRSQFGFISLALLVPFISAFISFGLPALIHVKIPEFASASLTVQAIIIVVAMRRYKLFTVSVATAAPNIIATMADGLFLLNAEKSIIMANNSAAKMLGYTSNDLTNRPFVALFSTDAANPAAVTDPIMSSRNAQQTFDLKTKDGKKVPVNLAVSYLHDDNGETAGVVCLVRDITENRRNEEKLKSAAHRLQQGNQELQEFLFAASHHLQEPLRKIRTLGSRLRAEPSVKESTQVRDYLGRMVRSAQWMQRLLDSLREYLAIETDSAATETLDLHELVRTAAGLVEDRNSKPKPVFEIGQLPIIEGRRSQLGNLFRHLLENAAKFRKTDSAVHVQITGRMIVTTRDAGQSGGPVCEIKIKDNGTGFDNQYHERIFGVFQRLNGIGNEHSGAGIGLAICRKIAQYHGGSISAQGEPGTGAVFTLLLPVQQDRHRIDM